MHASVNLSPGNNVLKKSFLVENGAELYLIVLGGGLCCLSSFPHVWDEEAVPKGDARFYLALFGQAITGIACPFVSSVPTKVSSQNTCFP